MPAPAPPTSPVSVFPSLSSPEALATGSLQTGVLATPPPPPARLEPCTAVVSSQAPRLTMSVGFGSWLCILGTVQLGASNLLPCPLPGNGVSQSAWLAHRPCPTQVSCGYSCPGCGSPGPSAARGAPHQHWIGQLLLTHFLRHSLTSSGLRRVVNTTHVITTLKEL